MLSTSFYEVHELKNIGLRQFGDNVHISRNARFYCPEKILIGNNVRIDDFCILSGKVEIGDYVHVSSSTTLTGGVAGIIVEEFANISQRVNIFANSDDFTGETMTNPMVPEEFKNLVQGEVRVCRHAIIACGSVILPHVTVNEGAVLGALSLAKTDLEAWAIYGGVPARKLSERKRDLLKLEKQFMGME